MAKKNVVAYQLHKQNIGGAMDKVDFESLACAVCGSEGPFARAFQCSFKQEARRHTFLVCTSKRCEKGFEKDTCNAADKGCEYKVAIRIRDYAKKGVFHCSHCFFMLKDVQLPEIQAVEDELPPPPPASAPPHGSSSSVQEETNDEDPPSDSLVDPRAPELPELDLDNLVIHIKDSDDAGRSPIHAGKKHGKKNKKQGNTLNNEIVQALFFEDDRVPKVVEEKKVTVPTKNSKAKSSAPPRTAPAGSVIPTVSTPPCAEWGKRTSPEGSNRIDVANSLSSKRQAEAKTPAQSPTSTPAVTRSSEICSGSSETASSAPKNLPVNWKAAWDQSSKSYYYWNTKTRETTWDFPSRHEKDEEEFANSATDVVKKEKSETFASSTSPTVSTMCSFASREAVEYLVVRSWIPSESDKTGGTCMRVTHGERVVLESETLDGWGIGSVIPEAGESVRQGRFPRKVLSDNPVSNPKILAKGVRVKVIDEFTSPANGYLSTSMGEMLVVKYQAEPFIWVWAEAEQDSSRNGWVPEAVLVIA